MTPFRLTSIKWLHNVWLWMTVATSHLLTLSLASEPRQPAVTVEGFSVPQAGYEFVFPRDHGSHPDFKIEWWYVTGHLFATGNQRFGFQATFFRQASPDRQGELHLAHMAWVDLQTGRFLHQERLNRPGWDAEARVGQLSLRNGPWSLRMTHNAPETLELSGGVRSDVHFAFQLVSQKPLVVFGENSLSRKGSDPHAASYYLTFSRLSVEGQLTIGTSAPLAVTGQAWLDHEISSSQLSQGQVGWDWVSLQLHDEPRELMLYRLRRADGSADPASTLQWVDPQGKPQRAPFTWEVLSTWTSSETGAVYPARVRIQTTDPATNRPRSFTVEPLFAAQELPGELAKISYWEGACRVKDETGREVGSAYMELTGYAKALEL
ncbi:MAG TPA: lipocalin-like domain-containing protein [Opitutaceae bacterium]|nr:lipocalin-like domain-containing protein [Opitutaceae bacterium]